LATTGFGTALGIVRALWQSGKLEHVYYTETRPYLQGSRLTGFELAYEGIPSTLICDSMASFLMKTRKVDAVVVGADRIALNGDTANKIGTYQLAIAANYHRIPFVVAAPVMSVDELIPDGDHIVIEERHRDEVAHVTGPVVCHSQLGHTPRESAKVQITLHDNAIWNPAFDVTPAPLISAIVTERGYVAKSAKGQYDLAAFIHSSS
jgi:methylthioribose-1-phosphate isomerase